MWKHVTRPIYFCLCVDDLCIKYFDIKDPHHLLDKIGKIYNYTVDWEGKNYCGLAFNWNYNKGYVDVSISGYIQDALQRLQYKPKKTPLHSPHHYTPYFMGIKGSGQYASDDDTSPLLSPKETTYIQSIAGTFLHYPRALDYTLLPALNQLASQQAHPTYRTRETAQQIIDYVHIYPHAYLRVHASDMILNIDSDASYLVAPKARSRVAGYYQLASHPDNTPHFNINGDILVECKTLRHVVESSAEAETTGVFFNAQNALPTQTNLIALNHPQPPTPIKTDNSSTNGFIHNNIHQKSLNPGIHHKTQNQFNFYWKPGGENETDCFTKNHPTIHHSTKNG